MPDEQNTGVNGNGTPAPSPGENQPSIPVQEVSAAGATAQPQTGGPGPIPYERFKEVNERAKSLEAQNAEILRQAQSYAQVAQRLIEMQQSQRQPTAPQIDPEEQALENEIRGILGDDEAGKKAERAIEAKARLMFKRFQKENGGPGVNPAEIQRIVDEKVGAVVATFSTNSQIQGWVNSGVISPDDGAKIASQVANAIQQNPQWGTKENQPLLVSQVFTNLVTQGQIKPYSKPLVSTQPGTPFQPGGVGGPAQPSEADSIREAEEMAQKFPSLAGKDPKKIAQRWKGVELNPIAGSMSSRRS